MSGLAIVVAISLISFVFNKITESGKDSTEKRKQMPPIGGKPENPSKIPPQRKSLVDYAKSMAEEFDKQFEEPEQRKKMPNRPKPAAQKIEQAPPEKEERRQNLQEVMQERASERAANRTSDRVSNREQMGGSRSNKSILEYSNEIQSNREKALKQAKSNGHSKNPILPKSRKKIAQALVLTEVLGPPVSKRK